MDTFEWVSALAFPVSATAFAAAAFLYLVRQTKDVPSRQRVAAMAAVGWGGLRRYFPSQHTFAAIAVGIGGFLVGAFICGVTWYVLLRLYASTVPKDDNVVAGAAEAALIIGYAGCGSVFSIVAGLVSGIASGRYVSRRMSPRGSS